MSDEYVSPVGFRILDEFGHDFVQMVTSIGFYFMDFLTKRFKVISFVNSCTVARISCRKVLQRLLSGALSMARSISCFSNSLDMCCSLPYASSTTMTEY